VPPRPKRMCSPQPSIHEASGFLSSQKKRTLCHHVLRGCAVHSLLCTGHCAFSPRKRKVTLCHHVLRGCAVHSLLSTGQQGVFFSQN
jgi:hypothetical protein